MSIKRNLDKIRGSIFRVFFKGEIRALEEICSIIETRNTELGRSNQALEITNRALSSINNERADLMAEYRKECMYEKNRADILSNVFGELATDLATDNSPIKSPMLVSNAILGMEVDESNES